MRRTLINDLTLSLPIALCLSWWVGFQDSTVLGQFRDASAELQFGGGGKAAFADFNGDGFVDLYAGKLYRNLNGKKFVTADAMGVGAGEGIWGDYNNDGFPDLFLFTGAGALYKNQGGKKFEKVAFPSLPTVNSRGAVWLDMNNDGWLDLYVGGYEIWTKAVHPDVIYLNQGDGTFKEQWRSKANYSARGVTAADLDEDGIVDVYVSNYRLQPNALWKSDGKGHFTDVASTVNAAGTGDGPTIGYTGGIRYRVFGHTIGSALGDLDNDGHIDIFVGNFSHPRPGQDRPQFLRNLGPAGQFKFEDRSSGSGLAWQESFASAALADYDNDGDLDLYFTTVYGVGSGGIRNYPVLYSNSGKWKFSNQTKNEKIPNLGPTYQAAWADIDNDGDMDLCTAGRIFLNERKEGNWIGLQLIGDGKTINRSAIGAIARIQVGQQILTRHAETGTGEGNQNDMRLHFGLGGNSASLKVEITWPGGRKQVLNGLEPGRYHRIEAK